jgi:uncharacterized membrane protein YqaE (UPF0057 family)
MMPVVRKLLTALGFLAALPFALYWIIRAIIRGEEDE